MTMGIVAVAFLAAAAAGVGPATMMSTVSPRALAVLRLMTSSNLVGCSTGKSAGLAPLSILSIYDAARRYICRRSAPYQQGLGVNKPTQKRRMPQNPARHDSQHTIESRAPTFSSKGCLWKSPSRDPAAA